MKKYLMLLAVTAGLATASFAQGKEKEEKGEKYEKHEKNEKKEHVNVPAAVKSAFEKQYAGVSAKWEKEKGKYEANFEQNGIEMSVLYEPNGTVAETEAEIKVNELPSTVMDYVKTHYKGASIKEASKITKANGDVNYEAEVKGKDLIFDSNGKFLKSEKD